MRGKAKVNYIDQEGLIQSRDTASYDFIYKVSTVKAPGWYPGDRAVLPDGREFVYALSTGASELFAAHGCEFSYAGLVSYTAFGVSAAIGDTEITIPAATHAALDEDELRGGTVLIFDGATDLATTTRRIIGNDATAADVAFKVYLDAGITNAIVAGTEACEVYRNPYAGIVVASDAAKPKAGVPASYVSAAANYFWVQTKGICWVAPQSSVTGNEGVGVMWRHDGSIEAVATALTGTVPNADGTQYAGHLVAGTADGNGPLLMLK